MGLKKLCVCVAMFHLGHTSITTSSSPPPHSPTRLLLISPTGAHRQTQAHNPNACPLITHKLLPSLCSRGLMGNLLKVLACTELEHGPIVFLDFERETIRFFFFYLVSVTPFLFVAFALFPPSIPSVSANHFSSFHLYLPLSPLGSSALPFDLGSRDWHLASF